MSWNKGGVVELPLIFSILEGDSKSAAPSAEPWLAYRQCLSSGPRKYQVAVCEDTSWLSAACPETVWWYNLCFRHNITAGTDSVGTQSKVKVQEKLPQGCVKLALVLLPLPLHGSVLASYNSSILGHCCKDALLFKQMIRAVKLHNPSRLKHHHPGVERETFEIEHKRPYLVAHSS